MTPKIELEWLIYYKCNYRCPYCFFDGMWEEAAEHNRYLPLERWIEAWHRIFKKYESVRILITGGEPFIYPNFVELLKELSKYFSIGFDTNLSCSKEELTNFIRYTVSKNISLGLSFHPMFADFDSFLGKALFLKGNGFNICIQYVTYPPQMGQMKFFRDRFTKKGLYFIPLAFRGTYNGMNYPDAYTEEEKKQIYSVTESLETEHKERVKKQLDQIRSKNRLCRAGQVYARIDTDGTVYRCGHSISSPNNKPIGNFFDEGFKLLEEPLPCEQEFCPCEFRWLVEDYGREVKQ